MKATHKIAVSFVAAVLLVVLIAAASVRAFRQVEAASEARKHTYAEIIRANVLLSELGDAETGQRGFVLTGDEAFLEPYLAVRDGVGGHLDELRSLVANDAARKYLDALRPLVDAKVAELARVIDLHRRHDGAAAMALISSGLGKRLMDSIRAEMRGFIQIEEAALARHEAELQANLRRLFGIILAACLFGLLFALSFVYLIYRETQHRLKNLVFLETRHLLEIQEETNRQLQHANGTLQISEEKLAVTLNSIGDAVMATDAEGRVTLLNPLAERLTGWTHAQAAGRPVEEVFHIINEDTRQPSASPLKETLENGTTQGLANHTVLIARDGRECIIADSCAPIRDRSGGLAGAVLVFRDITEADTARQALRDFQFYTRSLFESNSDALMTTNPAGIITDVNKQMEVLTGCTRDELIGGPFKGHFTDPDRAAAAVKLVLNVKTVANYELTARARDGRQTMVSFNATTFYDRDRRLQGVFASARDITERNRLDRVVQERNAELENAKSVAEEANRAKTEFLSGMSHELRAPLDAILGFARLMESGNPTPSQKRNLDQILKAGWYLLELIDEILDLALIESGKMALSTDQVSLADVMLECRAMIEPQAQKRSIGVTFPSFEAPCFVKADRARVKQALLNLLFNALKYNRPGGAVSVECTSSPPDSIRIGIRDTGSGLEPEQLAQLFQPFNRLGKEAGAEEGAGIGLVLTRRLVELMGGNIGATSKTGVGSLFWIELKLAPVPKLAAGKPEVTRRS